MNFLNVTQEQIQQFLNTVSTYMKQIHDEIHTITTINLNISQLYKVVTGYFMEQRELTRYEILESFLSVYNPNYVGQDYVKGIQDMIEGNNLAGKIIAHRDNEEMYEYYDYVLSNIKAYINYQQENKMIALSDQLFDRGYQNIVFSSYKFKYYNIVKIKMLYHKYLKQIFQRQEFNRMNTLLKAGQFDKEKIDFYYQLLQNKNVKHFPHVFQHNFQISQRERVINQLYEQVIKNNNNNREKYNCYQVLHYLMTISNKQFQKQFTLDNDDVKAFIKAIKGDSINNLQDLQIVISIGQYLDYNVLYIFFSDQFKLEQIPNEVILNLFQNIENKLQWVRGSELLIARRVSDNKIIKCQIFYNKYEIQRILNQLMDGQLYDIIIRTEYEFDNFGKIKMRYLNYIYLGSAIINISLMFPQDLVTTSVCQVKINNMNQCYNLRNLRSINNIYNKADICALQNLKKILSHDDKYENEETCFLNDIFQNNTLEYVYVENSLPDSNIVGSFTLSHNIQQLHYLEIQQSKANYDFILDLSKKQPSNLRFYNVQTVKDGNYQYGSIKGNLQQLTQLERNLIHYLRKKE